VQQARDGETGSGAASLREIEQAAAVEVLAHTFDDIRSASVLRGRLAVRVAKAS
jgi:hypothetical protein